MKTGLVATSTITHATPAAFAAHRISRNDEVGVALDFLENKVDLLLGGGRNVFANRSRWQTDGWEESCCRIPGFGIHICRKWIPAEPIILPAGIVSFGR